MPLKKHLDHVAEDLLSARGLLGNDLEALTPCQKECLERITRTVTINQEAYLTKHPEALAMLKLYVASLVYKRPVAGRKSVLRDMAFYFTRPAPDIISDINKFVRLEGPPFVKDAKIFTYKDQNLEDDIQAIIAKHYPPELWMYVADHVPTPDTASSSFVSKETSSTTPYITTPAAAAAWENRIKKKFIHSFRLQSNFKGENTQISSSKALFSPRDSYRITPPRPCECFSTGTYNRYAKDRFGVYLLSEKEARKEVQITNVIVTPISSRSGIQTDYSSESSSIEEESSEILQIMPL